MKKVLFPGERIEIAVVSNGFIVSLRPKNMGETDTPIAIAENLLDIGDVLNDYFTLPTLEDQDGPQPHDNRQGSQGGSGLPFIDGTEIGPSDHVLAEGIGQAPGTDKDGVKTEAANPGEDPTE